MLDDVTDSVPLAEARRHNRSTNQWKVDLSAMRMAGDRQIDPRGKVRKNVGVVREGEDGRRSGNVANAFRTSWRPSQKSLIPTSENVHEPDLTGRDESSSTGIPADSRARWTRGASNHQS